MKLSTIASLLHLNVTGSETEIQTVTTDSRTLEPGALFVALQGEKFDGHDFIAEATQRGAACLLVNRPITSTLPVFIVKDTLQALTQLAAGYRETFNHLPIVGLTGSCGKTTTKSFIAKIFEQVAPTLSTEGTLNNHIGVPLTLMRLRPIHRYAVIEMGANHLGEIAQLTRIVRPTTALITNIAPVHLEGFGSLAGVVAGKSEIFEGLSSDGIAIINADEPAAMRWRDINEGRSTLSFGVQHTADISAEKITCNANGQYAFTLLSPQGKIPIALQLPGEHQVMNALAAAACAHANQITLEHIKAGLESLEGVNRRLCRYQTSQGAEVIDDSYNANPTSTLAALTLLQRTETKKIFVFADMLELGTAAEHYHKEIGIAAKNLGIQTLYTYGKLAQVAATHFGENAFHFTDKRLLIAALAQEMDANTTVLVKGSNSMKMWEVVQAITQGHSVSQ